MTVKIDKTTQVSLSMSENELEKLLNCISSLVTEKIDLKKYEPIFAIKDAIVLKENKFL